MLRRFSTSAFRLQTGLFYQSFASVLKTDLKKSMLAKDTVRKDTIKHLRSELKNFEIDTKGAQNDEHGIARVIAKMIKTREKLIDEYTALKREDLAENEAAQKSVLEEYLKSLPVSSDEEVAKAAEELIAGYDDLPTMSTLMKSLNFKELAEKWKTSEASAKKYVVAAAKKK